MLEDVRKYVEVALEQVNRTRDRIAELVQAEVKRQLKAVGIVTRDDLDAIRARVRDLERAGGGSRGSGSAAKTAKRSSAKKSGARKAGGRKSAAKTSPASPSTGAESSGSRSQGPTG